MCSCSGDGKIRARGCIGGPVLRVACCRERQTALRDRPAGRAAARLCRIVGGLPLAERDGDTLLCHHHYCRQPRRCRATDRMPLILERADWSAWLGELAADATAMLHPSPLG